MAIRTAIFIIIKRIRCNRVIICLAIFYLIESVLVSVTSLEDFETSMGGEQATRMRQPRLKLRSATLAAMAQQVIGKHQRHHRFADRHGTNADARVVAALGLNFGVLAGFGDRVARGQD